ncbi:MAG: hypothetical protein DCC71_09110 [Proteobacteria bacterium]|nr:MAG: hypothetical protein DCC71_09110 [Pseudomonadota bacterium]
MPRRTLLAALAVLAAAPALAQYEAGAPPAARPRYETLRFEEDWSALARPDSLPSRDVFDPIKYVPLARDGRVWIGFGAEARLRAEGWSNWRFGAPRGSDGDDVFLLTRLRTYADLHLGERVRVFAEAKSALATEIDLPPGKSPADVDTIALQNGFAELVPWKRGARALTLRAGRQELLFGAERLVGPFDWSNARRTFDGVTLAFEQPGLGATALFMRPVVVEQHDANEHRGGDRLYGVYTALAAPLLPSGLTLDLYWLGLDRGDRAVNGTAGAENRHTLGTRLGTRFGDSGFDAELETALQVGEIGERSITAGMVSTELGYWRPDWFASPRFFAGFDWASGDADAGGSVGTFDPLFPTGHKFFGAFDAVGRSNVLALAAGVAARPLPATTATLAVHRFWRASDDDALYSAAGAVLRPGAASNAHGVGTEIDVTVAYRLDVHTRLGVGWAHFFPDSFVASSGPARDGDFVWLWIEYAL